MHHCSVSRLRAVGLYHDLELTDNLQEVGKPFEPLPRIWQSTHTPTDIQEFFIKPDIENLIQNYDTHNSLPAIQSEESKLSLDNTISWRYPRLEQKLMSLPKLTPEKIITLQKNNTFCK